MKENRQISGATAVILLQYIHFLITSNSAEATHIHTQVKRYKLSFNTTIKNRPSIAFFYCCHQPTCIDFVDCWLFMQPTDSEYTFIVVYVQCSLSFSSVFGLNQPQRAISASLAVKYSTVHFIFTWCFAQCSTECFH